MSIFQMLISQCQHLTKSTSHIEHIYHTYNTLLSFDILEPKNGDTYIYTTGMDEGNLFLFCNTDDNSVQLSNLYWRREDRVGFYPNPLDLQELANVLKYTNDHDMECFDIESENEIMSIKLLAQGLL